jgi:two-component system nitrogen regulation sensor histidine kinase NtrY
MSSKREPAIRLQAADIHDVINHTISLFEGIFSDIDFDTSYAPDVPSSIQIDPEQMNRVFINLFDNAIDAMNKKGKININTSFDREHQSIRVEVSDTGPGISQKDKEKLFLPHFSTKSKGSGLGLAIVNQIINEHNGNIDAENNKPFGAKFTIQIPI